MLLLVNDKKVIEMTIIKIPYNEDREDRNYFTIGNEGYLNQIWKPAKETLAKLPCIGWEAPNSIDELLEEAAPSKIIKIEWSYNPGDPDKAA